MRLSGADVDFDAIRIDGHDVRFIDQRTATPVVLGYERHVDRQRQSVVSAPDGATAVERWLRGTIDFKRNETGIAAASLADGEELGKPDATVKLEIWTDFQCPICGTLVKDYFPRLITDFVQTGQVRIVAHDIAILGATADNESVNAAVGAICAGDQGKYWQYHDYLFYNQSGENKGGFSADRLKLFADYVGVDRAKWDACVADPALATQMKTNTVDASRLGVTSTPSFRVVVIFPVLTANAVSYEDW